MNTAFLLRLLVFLIFNFAALGIGGLFTGEGVPSDWYQQLNKAPWTPPGWVFGAAWTTIMICFSFFMARLWANPEHRQMVLVMYIIQWILNAGWNPLFFYAHSTTLALVVIVALTVVVAWFFVKGLSLVQHWAWLIAPYLLWLLIATSLNGYVVFKN